MQPLAASAGDEGKFVLLPYGNMDSWLSRNVQESGVIGKNLRTVYEIGKPVKMPENTPYTDYNGSPWATSSVMAKVKGVVKASVTVQPEARDGGYCARLETVIERVKVLGLFNLQVLATGTVFLGSINEPITSTDNPNGYLDRGIPFTKKPKAIRFDYKARNTNDRYIASGLGKPSPVEGKNKMEVTLYLQRRWEDENGKVYARRLATVCYPLPATETWKNGFTIPLYYGDFTQSPDYSGTGDLEQGESGILYCKNSKGEMVQLQEVGWGGKDEQPTHLVLAISSGNGGAYVGAPGSILWVDNVGLVY